ncbi:MAG: FAD-dependent oxidoreductase [Pirellulaceae bacterium]|nr:FAD-dependent oxidoreductase [Pirellulaceae bacterium]
MLRPMRFAVLGWLLFTSLLAADQLADRLLVEAESFERHGGWELDTQFIQIMGSPYLLAHGLGRPVADATTTVEFPSVGKYRVFVRTKDWVARWEAPGQPGRFQLLVDGRPLDETFGTKGAEWFWHDGGTVEIQQPKVKLALRDLTGFNGRCDAIYFTKDLNDSPPNDFAILPAWRRQLLGLSDQPTEKSGYDLVVVGGGYSGMGAAIAAARLGCRVALIQDRPVLGGNGSSEVRVWANGLIRRGKYPRIGEIIEEFADRASKSPGRAEEFGDELKEQVVRAEKNIDLFLNHFAHHVETDGDKITAVLALDTRTSEEKRFSGRLFCDGTGHGTIGSMAGAHYDMTPKGRMGMSNMWRWDMTDQPTEFPETPWALDLEMKDFPYPRDFHGQWFWESGFDKDPIHEAEAIRDWNLRAVFGAFQAMKNRGGAADHKNAVLSWVAFIGGPRESRRLLGDVILSEEDIVEKRDFPDGCVPSTWSIDLHYPKQQYAEKFPDNPFISIAEFDHRVDRTYGYPVPYRCFYSRNISNLFMAGRCISVTHEALGTVRVMKTCGMMGEVVGRATAVCVKNDCLPRDVYEDHWSELDELLRLPGKARRDTVDAKIVIPDDALPEASAEGPPTGLDPKSLPGLVIDDRAAKKTGSWTQGTGLKGYIGWSYLYASSGGGASIRFEFQPAKPGQHEVRLAYLPHENRGTRVPVTVISSGGEKTLRIDMRKPAPLEHGFISLGKFNFGPGETVAVVVGSEDAGGTVHADAIQVLPVE